MDWRRLTDPGSAALREARLQVHHAAQLAAAPGKELGEPEPDFGHAALAWLPAAEALAGPAVGGWRAALRSGDLTLIVLDDAGGEVAARPLAGTTLAGGLAWLGERFGAELAPVRRDIPHHPVADGAPFAPADPAPYEEIARLFAGTAAALGGRTGGPVRCWPHHFDIARLHVLDESADPEEARSVGYGMTPGDDQYADPYWYVTPWPYPDPAHLPELPAGGWHTEGWVGAVLHAAEVVPAADQRAVVEAFFEAAGSAAEAALG